MSRLRRRAVGLAHWGMPDRDAAGQPVCRWCRTVVRPPRRTFCGDPCVHEWRLRSDVSYLRAELWRRDAGVCQICRADLRKARRTWLRQKPPAANRRARREWRAAEPRWEADHIVPVADGGGLCGLENYRVLCVPCHRSVTQAWRRSRRAAIELPRAG